MCLEAPEELPGGAREGTLARLGSLGSPWEFPGRIFELLWDPSATSFRSLWVSKGTAKVKIRAVEGKIYKLLTICKRKKIN